MDTARSESDAHLVENPLVAEVVDHLCWEDYVCLPPLWHDSIQHRVTISQPTSSLDLVKAAWGKCLASVCESRLEVGFEEAKKEEVDPEDDEEDPLTMFTPVRQESSRTNTAQTPQGAAVVLLVRICFDSRSISYLVEQWRILLVQTNGASFPLSVRLLQCSFANEQALQAMVDFLDLVGSNLVELSILNDVRADWTPIWLITEQELVSLLQGIQRVKYLPFLRLENMDLLGRSVGNALHRLLSNNTSPNNSIRGIHFSVTSFDDDMFYPLLDGIREHALGLSFLHLGGTSSFDVERFGMLVDAMADSPTRNTLCAFHIEQIFDTEPDDPSRFRALSVLARLLSDFPSLQRLVWMLFDLLERVDSSTHEYLEFVNALAANTSLKFLEMFSDPIHDEIAGPLFYSLTKNSSLRELRIGSMIPETSRLATSLENCLPAMKGLCSLTAPLDIQNASLRQALARNTVLTKIIDVGSAGLDGTGNLELLHSSGKIEKDGEICRILARNKLLKRVSSWEKEHHREMSISAIWLLSMEQLTSSHGEGVSAIFNFLMWSSPLLLNSLSVT